MTVTNVLRDLNVLVEGVAPTIDPDTPFVAMTDEIGAEVDLGDHKGSRLFTWVPGEPQLVNEETMLLTADWVFWRRYEAQGEGDGNPLLYSVSDSELLLELFARSCPASVDQIYLPERAGQPVLVEESEGQERYYLVPMSIGIDYRRT